MKFLPIVLLSFSLLLGGCNTLNNIKDYKVKKEDISNYTYPTTKLVALGILNSSKTIEERNKRKGDLLFISGKIKSFTLPTHPTPGSIYEDIDLIKDKKAWELLLYCISENYESFLNESDKITVENVSLFFSETSRALDEAVSM